MAKNTFLGKIGGALTLNAFEDKNIPIQAPPPDLTISDEAKQKAADDAAMSQSKKQGRAANVLAGGSILTSSAQTTSAGRQLLGS